MQLLLPFHSWAQNAGLEFFTRVDGLNFPLFLFIPAWRATWWAGGVYGSLFFLAVFFMRRYEQNRRRLKLNLELKMQEIERNGRGRKEDAFIQKVQSIVEEHYADENFSLPLLCQKIGMSRSQLYRKMQALIQIAPSDFIRSYRLKKAKSIIESTDLTISEVAWQVGFKDPAHFSKSFQEEFGYPPSSARK